MRLERLMTDTVTEEPAEIEEPRQPITPAPIQLLQIVATDTAGMCEGDSCFVPALKRNDDAD
jgi:hypothetical protein